MTPDGTTGDTGTTTNTSTGAAATGTTGTTGAATGAAATGAATTVATGTGAATTGAAATGTGTAATGATGTAATGTTTAPAWPDNWRQVMATGADGKVDDKELKLLERYADPLAVNKARRELQVKLSSGQVKTTLPADATPEQITEYRKENGIPETPDKYDLTLEGGLVIGEADKPLVAEVLKGMHAQNAPPGEVKRWLGAYFKLQEEQRVKVEEMDSQFKADSLTKLGEMYKGDAKRNIRLVTDFVKGEGGEDIFNKIMGARLPNGRLAGADPEFIDFLYKQALFKNPQSSAIGGNSDAHIKTAQAELAALQTEMKDEKGPYWKGPQSAAKQARVRELNEALAARR